MTSHCCVGCSLATSLKYSAMSQTFWQLTGKCLTSIKPTVRKSNMNMLISVCSWFSSHPRWTMKLVEEKSWQFVIHIDVLKEKQMRLKRDVISHHMSRSIKTSKGILAHEEAKEENVGATRDTQVGLVEWCEDKGGCLSFNGHSGNQHGQQKHSCNNYAANFTKINIIKRLN